MYETGWLALVYVPFGMCRWKLLDNKEICQEHLKCGAGAGAKCFKHCVEKTAPLNEY